MALPDTEQSSDKKPDAKPAAAAAHEKKEKPYTKLVIRRLPPHMDQSTFKNQISPIPGHDYMYYVRGDASLGENSFSRAYINFTAPNDVFDFKEKFDNYVFVDSTGHEYPAVVEFASFQKIPKKRNKTRVDPKCGTIEQDPYYLEFVESLSKPPEVEEKPEYTYQIAEAGGKKTDETTPLLEYLKSRKAEQKRLREERREERRRKETERRRFQEERNKKRYEEKSPGNKPSKNSSGSSKDKAGGDNDSRKSDSAGVADDTHRPGGKDRAEKPERSQSEKDSKQSASYYGKSRDKKFDKHDDATSTGSRRGNRDANKSKFPPAKKDHADKREFNKRRDDRGDFHNNSKSAAAAPGKYDDHHHGKKDGNNKDGGPPPQVKEQKRVKKYSEKREERKLEAQKRMQEKEQKQVAVVVVEEDESGAKSPQSLPVTIKTVEEVESEMKKQIANNPDQSDKPPDKTSDETCERTSDKTTDKPPADKVSDKAEKPEDDIKRKSSTSANSDTKKSHTTKSSTNNNKDDTAKSSAGDNSNSQSSQRRIRNKDRPTIAIYRPGMLTNRKLTTDPEAADNADGAVNKKE